MSHRRSACGSGDPSAARVLKENGHREVAVSVAG
jgi:hypothetical protein